MAKSAILSIDIVSDASKASKAFNDVGADATGLASDLGKVERAAGEADRKMRITADGADNLDSKSAQATGSLGALSSGFELVGLEKYAMGLQSAALATDFMAGVGEGLNLILELQWVQTVKNTAVKIKDAVVTKTVAAATRVWAAAQLAVNAVMAGNPIALVVIAIIALVAAIVIAYKKSETFRRIVDAAFSAIQRIIIGTVNAVVGFVKSHWRLLLVILTGPFGLAAAAIVKFGPRILDSIQSAYGRVVGFLSGMKDRIVSAAFAAFDRAREVVTNSVGRLASAVSGKVDAVVRFFTGLPGRIVKAVGDLGKILYNAGVDILQGLLDGINDKWEDVKDKFSDITGAIPNIKGPPARDKALLRNAGELIMQGLLDGISSKEAALRSLLGSVTSTISTGLDPNVGASSLFTTGPGGLPSRPIGGVQIVVQGAVDPVSTAKQIRGLLEREANWTGRLVGVTA